MAKLLYDNIQHQEDNKVTSLLPDVKSSKCNLRNSPTYPLFSCRPESLKNGFIPKCVNLWDQIKMSFSIYLSYLLVLYKCTYYIFLIARFYYTILNKVISIPTLQGTPCALHRKNLLLNYNTTKILLGDFIP